ncbi:MAG: hypothetical protein NW220_05745 [Leptolyngbyaceae cyanobacterium bins.349]|nr:hypothetical protein [Leptolyngbyaceae cyanobacterium bins.349]
MMWGYLCDPCDRHAFAVFWSLPILLWSIWLIYISFLFFSDFPPGESLLHVKPDTLHEAIALSLNFWFVLPALVPKLAPVLHPALEGLFNLTVAWGLLFWGFLIDRRNQRFPTLPFLMGTALLTNVFYLPWLALRRSNPSFHPDSALTPLERLTESRLLPIALTVVLVASLGWAAVARPEFGNFSDRWQALMELVLSDRLAYSFVIDLGVFWIFQSWLVTDDMQRRNWQDASALWVARLLPFIGLVIYLLRRPRMAKGAGRGRVNAE